MLQNIKTRLLKSASSGSGAPIHYLHIGKTAGTQIKLLSEKIDEALSHAHLVMHKHHVALADLPPDEEFFFSIRHPQARFKSGFYSRKRKGAPRHYSEWSPHEERAFTQFEHANDLAEALSDPALKTSAMCAMKTIRHTAQMQVSWFDRAGYFLDVRPPIHIIRQEHFDRDFATFCTKLGLASVPEIASDPVKAHRNSYEGIPPLSDFAKANLATWYDQDIQFYKMCNDWVEKNSAEISAAN
jgi:hypothetical protein